MKSGSVNVGSPAGAANSSPAVKVAAPAQKPVSTTAPKTNQQTAVPNQLKSKPAASQAGTPALKPKALAKAVQTPGKAAHNAKVRKANYNSQSHKQALAKQGEDAARRALRKDKNYNSFPSMKHNAIHGIDFAALKRAKDGKIKSAAVVESKASRNRSLGPSSFHEQTTHEYVKQSLLKAKLKNVKHADDLYRMAKEKKLTIIGSAYNKATGQVRLHKVFEPRTAKPESPDTRGSKRKK